MKKILLLSLFTLWISFSYAQFWQGVPVYFCSMNSNVYNPEAHKIVQILLQ